MRRSHLKLLLASSFSVFLAACSSPQPNEGDGGSSYTGNKISGKVSLGPIENASVDVFKLNDDGTRGQLLGNSKTDANGDYTVELSEKSGSVEIVAKGGKYQEESSGEIVERDSQEEVRSVVDDISAKKEVAVTALTDLATERAKTLKDQGLGVKEAVQLAIHEIQTSSGVNDISKPPIDPRTSAESQTSDEDRKKHAMVLAGISQMAKEKGVKSLEIAKALASDFKEDGKFDGTAAGAPIVINKSADVLGSKDWTEKLPAAMSEFANNKDRNLANLTGSSIPTVKDENTGTAPATAPPPRVVTKVLATNLLIMTKPEFPAGLCIPLIVQTVDSKNQVVRHEVAVVANLVLPDDLALFSSPTCSEESIVKDKTVAIGALQGVKHAFIKTSKPNEYKVLINDSSESAPLKSSSMSFKVTAALTNQPSIDTTLINPLKVMIMGPTKIPTNTCVPLNLSFLNSKDIPVPSDNDRSVSLTLNGDDGFETYSDPSCFTKGNTVAFKKFQTNGVIFIKAGNVLKTVVTASSSPLTPSNLTMASFQLSTTETLPPTTIKASKIEIISPVSFPKDTCIPVGIRHLSSDGLPVPVTESDVIVKMNLYSSSTTVSGFAFSEPTCSSSLSDLRIKKGWPETKMFIKLSAIGLYKLSAEPFTEKLGDSGTLLVPADLIPATKEISAFDSTLSTTLKATKLLFSNMQQIPTNTCIAIRVMNANDNNLIVPAVDAFKFALTSSSSNLKFYSGLDCMIETSTGYFLAGQGSTVVFAKATSSEKAISLKANASYTTLIEADMTIDAIDLATGTSTQKPVALDIIPASTSATAGACIPVRVRTVDSYGVMAPLATSIQTQLSGDGGVIFSNLNDCSSPIGSLAIQTTDKDITIFLKVPGTLGTYSFSIMDTSTVSPLRSSKKAITAVSASQPTANTAPVKMSVEGPSRFPVNACVPFSLFFVDGLGSKIPNNNIDRLMSIASMDLAFKVFSDSSCMTITSNFLIKANSASGQFYVKATADKGSALNITDTTMNGLPAMSLAIYSYLDSTNAGGTLSTPSKAEIKFASSTSSTQIKAGICTAMRFVLLDNNSLLAPAGPSGLNVNIGFNPLLQTGSIGVFSGSDCSVQKNQFFIPAGTPEVMFYIKGPTGVSGNLTGVANTPSTSSTTTSPIFAPGLLISFQ